MVFGQLTCQRQHAGFDVSLEAHQPKYYHLGFGSTVCRRNLGTANEKRNYKIFEEFAYVLIEEARRSCYKNDFEIEIDGNVYALDSTTIDLCLSVFWWAEFRKHKGGIKLHTLFDVKLLFQAFYISPMPRFTMSTFWISSHMKEGVFMLLIKHTPTLIDCTNSC
jgi:hypothetical protein